MSGTRPLAVAVTPMETRREVVLRVATLAEELGYRAFSVAEGWGSDAAVLLAEIATRTTRIELATGVLNIWGRSPAGIAMVAAGLAEVSGGRFTLGLGAGSPQLAEGLHGVPFRAPVRRMAAVAREVRGLLDGERSVGSDGSRGLRLAVPPRSRVPLALAALGPAAIRLCGELADAWYPFLMPVSGLKEGMCLLEEGAARTARSRPQIHPGIPTAVLPDPDAASGVAAWWVVFYLTSMGPLYAATLRQRGFGEAVDAVVAANPRGAPPTVPAAAQVLVDGLLVAGDAAAARAGLDRWYAAGAEMPVLVLPPNRAVEELEFTLRTLRPR
ncbi:MAG TPA: LLM class flavin-dependent oxidoreductase [Pseudonocardia sp.]